VPTNHDYEPLGRVLSGVPVEAELEAEIALNWCQAVTLATLSFKDKTVLAEARDAWFDHYRPRFIKAITVNGRHLKDDIGHLSVKSVLLGQVAASLAGTATTITKAVALQAAQQIECEKLTLFPQLHWCAA
jgi:hypothetical protein